MLASPDRELAERQPLLPGLGTVLDPEALAQAAKLHGLALPSDAEVAYVRFKPSTSCLVAYRPAGETGPPLYYATAFQRDSGKLVKALKRDVVHTARGPGRVILGEHAIELCVFPNDDHMPVLIPLSDLKRREKILREILPLENDAARATLSPLAYKPERRCVLKMTSNDGRKTVIRAYEKRGFEPALARATHFSRRGGEMVQRLAGYDAHHRLFAMEWREARVFSEELRSAPPHPFHAEAAGALLADLHAGDPDTLPEWTATGAVLRVDEIVSAFPVLCPDLAEHPAAVAGSVSRAVATLAPGCATIHGDFDARQVLVSEAGAAFIDLDEASSGPPAIDLGNFIAHLRTSAARGEIATSVASDATNALLRGYESRAALPSRDELRAATALALLTVAHEPFRQHREDWPREIASILKMAERELEA